jgi:hypothetical protein
MREGTNRFLWGTHRRIAPSGFETLRLIEDGARLYAVLNVAALLEQGSRMGRGSFRCGG